MPKFSQREQDVVSLLLQGKGNKQIALTLGIANRTVEFHLSNVYSKLGVNTRAEAILKLTKGHLRDSTGGLLVDSTVATAYDSTENGVKSIQRRINMRKLIFIFGGTLTSLLIIWGVIRLSIQMSIPEANLTAVSTITNPDIIPGTNAPSPTTASPSQTPFPPQVTIPPHTVNGYTVTIESYYADVSHVIFQLRITGKGELFKDYSLSGWDLFDENGQLLNSSGSGGPAIDPGLYQIEFVPVTLLKDDRVRGQVVFQVINNKEPYQTFATFNFDIDIPIYPETRFYPKQSTTANGLTMLLDSVTVTPTFTQVYLCFSIPSFAVWELGHQSRLGMNGKEVLPLSFRTLFDADLGGDRRAGSEPYWAPPTKTGRCTKVIFPIGSSVPTFLTLTIPQFEELNPDLLLTSQFAANYPGLTLMDAYYKYLEENNKVYKGPWVFNVLLEP
jgi:DNA-binding CsgD family transcriptional regulator